ncbi:MAG: amidohydrolase family protein [Cyclobacteriaceae bacterium]
MANQNKQSTKDPIVNCHTHIFTGDHVPPYIAKTFVFWPVYKWLNVHRIIRLYKFFTRLKNKWLYSQSSLYNRIKRLLARIKLSLFGRIFLKLFLYWLIINTLYIICQLETVRVYILETTGIIVNKLTALDFIPYYFSKIIDFFLSVGILLNTSSLWIQMAIVVLAFASAKMIRNLISFLLKHAYGLIKILPGKKSQGLIERYILLAKFAMYQKQSGIFPKLRHQYPDDSRFIALPMDMEFMDAGKVPVSYPEQMADMSTLKKSRTMGKYLEPFIFIDPRRIETHHGFLDCDIQEGKVTLKDCDVQNYLNEGFSGFKIYPALGYYPFDEALLPLWKYAADEELPIMTHCIGGTIYYRGKKKKEWNTHPVFLESDGKGNTRPLSLPQKKNVNFSVNFTHPLNYLCLVSEPLLRKLVKDAKSDDIRTLFGYVDDQTPLKHDLSHLKICLAHFGGEEEWVKYLESDRNAFSQRLIRDRATGLNFSVDNSSALNWNILSKIWHGVDWYSIICSLIVQNKNIYTDISYILSKPRILPLLQETLDLNLNPHLRKRVLFGTDFYVVRNHFSEKDLLVQIKAGLSDEEFDLIARENPKSYLR